MKTTNNKQPKTAPVHVTLKADGESGQSAEFSLEMSGKKTDVLYCVARLVAGVLEQAEVSPEVFFEAVKLIRKKAA